MGTDSILQQIESALGNRHPQADAMLWQRVDFICDRIKELKSAQLRLQSDEGDSSDEEEFTNLWC